MVKLQVNGQTQSFDGDPSMPLLWYLRDELALTGTKYGCGVALCGACTVHIDGEAAGAPRMDCWLGIQSQIQRFTSQFPMHRNREFIWA